MRWLTRIGLFRNQRFVLAPRIFYLPPKLDRKILAPVSHTSFGYAAQCTEESRGGAINTD